MQVSDTWRKCLQDMSNVSKYVNKPSSEQSNSEARLKLNFFSRQNKCSYYFHCQFNL